MAHYFASSLPSGSSLGDLTEWDLCVRSISLLQSLQESVPDAARTANIGGLFKGANYPQHSTNKVPIHRDPRRDEEAEDISVYMSRASDDWHMVRRYASSDVAPDAPPPWHPQSDYSLLLQRILDLDSLFPLQYRYATNDFNGQTTEALHERRDYWAPWLFIQFIHAATPTLLNHPFLLSLRLRNLRSMLPSTFIQQSFEQLSRHTAWSIHYLDLVERKQFRVTDPLIAHLWVYSLLYTSSIALCRMTGFVRGRGRGMRRVYGSWRVWARCGLLFLPW